MSKRSETSTNNHSSQFMQEYYANLKEDNDRLTAILVDLSRKVKAADEALVYYAERSNWNRNNFEPSDLGGWPIDLNGEPWKVAKDALEIVGKHNDK